MLGRLFFFVLVNLIHQIFFQPFWLEFILVLGSKSKSSHTLDNVNIKFTKNDCLMINFFLPTINRYDHLSLVKVR